MASFADQNSSFVSGRSSRSGTRKPKTKRLEPYVSPFVLEANKRAQQRVRERMSRARPPRIPSPPPVFQHDSGEWNNSVQSAGLFDPALRKQEIFRLEPRNRRNNNANQRPQAQNSSNSGVRNDSTTTTTSNNMTVRTNRDSPVRNINRAPYRNSERSQSPNENTWQQHSSDEVHRPKPSNNDAAPQARSTRSTSPIDERVMRDIYGADENAPDASSFTMRRQNQHQSSSGRPAFQAAEFQQFLREHGRPREPMDPQAMRSHYGNMIRDRLRQLLQQHREGKGDADDNATEPPVKPYPYFSKLRRQGSGSGVMGGYFRPADVVDTQLMTRDLMASMAQIMTAVGEIVTNQQQTQHRRRRSRKDWYKDHPLPTTSAATAAATSQGAFTASHNAAAPSGPSAPTVISSARVKSNNGTVPATPMALSELAALSATKGIAKLREKEASKEAKKATDPQRKEFMWDMAQALRPETILRDAVTAAGQGAIDPADIPLPKNKAAVFDMIFSKLQSIEQCEHDLISFLQAPREHPTDLPVDPVLQDFKLKKEKKKGSVSSSHHTPSVPLVPDTEDIAPPPRTTPVEQAKSAANSTFDFLKRYPPLGTISSCIRSDFEEYKLKLDKARKLRDAPFLKKNSDVAIAADTVADAICDRIIGAVATEIGGFVEDYSKNYVGKL